jgi:predicted RecA/RadA family phage recombinase
MSTNYVQEGRYLTVTAPYAVTAGQGVLVGSIFGVATKDAASGASVVIDTKGVHTLAKTSALAISIGDRLFWDDTNKVVNKTATAQLHVGIAVSAAANPSATVDMLLERVPPSGS